MGKPNFSGGRGFSYSFNATLCGARYQDIPN
jgi:hypothetical protein